MTNPYVEGATVNVRLFASKFIAIGTVDRVTKCTVTVEFIGPNGPETKTFRVRDGQTVFHCGWSTITPREV